MAEFGSMPYRATRGFRCLQAPLRVGPRKSIIFSLTHVNVYLFKEWQNKRSNRSAASMSESVIQAWEAAVYDDLHTLKGLVPSVVKPDASTHSPDNPIHTILMCAAAHGSVRCATYLISQRADVNKKNHMGFTALHWSAFHGRTECVPLLLRHHADLEAKTQDGRTALHIAASRGHLGFVKSVAENGGDLHAVSSNGWSAVFFAVRGDQRGVCQFLIERGVDWQCPDTTGKNALMVAEERKCGWALQILKKGAGSSSEGRGSASSRSLERQESSSRERHRPHSRSS